MRSHNQNLRRLAAAYQQGVITEEQYILLRNKQLSAIQYNKEYPPLPAILYKTVASPKAPQPSAVLERKTKRKWWLALPVVLLIGLLIVLFI